MDSSADPTHDLTVGSFPVVAFVAMFAATLAGLLVGVALDALVVGSRVVWVPLACSVLLEGIAGARVAAARLGRALTPAECARLSAYYSLALAAVSLPLVGWTLAARTESAAAPAHGAAVMLAFVVVSVLAAAVPRLAVMVLASRLTRRRP